MCIIHLLNVKKNKTMFIKTSHSNCLSLACCCKQWYFYNQFRSECWPFPLADITLSPKWPCLSCIFFLWLFWSILWNLDWQNNYIVFYWKLQAYLTYDWWIFLFSWVVLMAGENSFRTSGCWCVPINWCQGNVSWGCHPDGLFLEGTWGTP